MEAKVLTIIGGTVLAALITRSLLYKLERTLLFRPKKLEVDYDFDLMHYQDKFNKLNKPNIPATLNELFIKTKDGEKINIIYFHNPNNKSHMIFAHGNGGNMDGRINNIYTLGLMTSIVFFDYRGYGKSTGLADEKGIYRDAHAVWKFLVKHNRVNPASITLYGRSLGSSVMAKLACSLCDHKVLKPSALIMESGFSSIKDAAADHSSDKVKYIMRSSFDSMSYLKKIGNKIPVLISHSPSDKIVKFHNKDKLLKASKSHNTYFYQLRGGHNTPVHDKEYIYTIRQMLYA